MGFQLGHGIESLVVRTGRSNRIGRRRKTKRYDEADVPAFGLFERNFAQFVEYTTGDALVRKVRLDLEDFVEFALFGDVESDGEATPERRGVIESRFVTSFELG